jgi:hypothetical protein
MVWYQVACAQALLSRDDPRLRPQAVAALASAIAADGTLADSASRDQDLQAIWSDPQFQELVHAAARIRAIGQKAANDNLPSSSIAPR